MRRRPVASLILRTAAFGPAGLYIGLRTACGSDDPGGSEPVQSTAPAGMSASAPAVTDSARMSAPSMSTMIHIRSFMFKVPVSVQAGTSVTVMNTDNEAHTVTADTGSAFDVKVDAGATATFTAPSKPGSYAFRCKYHSDMHGVLVVK